MYIKCNSPSPSSDDVISPESVGKDEHRVCTCRRKIKISTSAYWIAVCSGDYYYFGRGRKIGDWRFCAPCAQGWEDEGGVRKDCKPHTYTHTESSTEECTAWKPQRQQGTPRIPKCFYVYREITVRPSVRPCDERRDDCALIRRRSA